MIPATIHFVSFCEDLKPPMVRLMLRVAANWRSCAVYLWTLESLVERLKTRLCPMARDLGYNYFHKVGATAYGNPILGFSWGNSREYNIYLKTIDSLRPLTNPATMQDVNVQQYVGEALLSDIFGLWILYSEGGMYISKEGVIDCRGRLSLPQATNKGILLGEHPSCLLPFTLSLVAAPSESDKVKRLCGALAMHQIYGDTKFLEIQNLSAGLGQVDVVPCSEYAVDESRFYSASSNDVELVAPFIQPHVSKGLFFRATKVGELMYESCMTVAGKRRTVGIRTAHYEAHGHQCKTAGEVIKEWFIEDEAMGICFSLDELKRKYSIQRCLGVVATLDHNDARNKISSELSESLRTRLVTAREATSLTFKA